ncbi:alpha/beta fold hydrolase [Horticoccus sp. 23ND18S-11]|uniref:alpha/beta fold hydrolase n=1 Tax=Horticoccus sp. 23ND18S-11 TaxID=3391832 RepID=UPI0039C9B322
MTKAHSLLTLIAFVSLAIAPSWAAAVETAVRITRDVAYLAPDRTEKLDLFLPATPALGRLSPALVWIHGGGWTGGTKAEARAQNVCGIVAAAGYVAVNIDYRLGDGAWPTNLHDCKNAVRYLRAHAAELKLDPNRIAVAGGSAGGHLALMVGMTGDQPEFEPIGAASPYPGVSSRVQAVINMYGIANLLTRQEVADDGTPTGKLRAVGPVKVFGAGDPGAAVYRAASPVTHITRTSPPVLILHGMIDKTVDRAQAEELARVLQANGVPHQLVLVPGAGHTFDLKTWSKKPLSRDLQPVVLDFLAQHLK